jgi:hypothetical protein
MTDILCDLCGNPTDGYCCHRCTADTAVYLKQAADLAGEVETTVALLARYAHRGAHRAAPADDGERPTASVNRSQPVGVFGWPASVTRPARGGLRVQRLPVDLNAAARAARAYADLSRWAELVMSDHGGEVTPNPGEHRAAADARFLLGQLEWIRHQPFADKAFEELRAAGAVIKRIVDSPPERNLVGRCDCRHYLYAYAGATTCTCAECGLRWDVEVSRNGLRKAMLDRMVTASEAGLLLAIFGIAGTRRRHAKTITMWAQRGVITVHPPIDTGAGDDDDPGGPLFRFADVFDRFTTRRDAAA